MPRHALPRARTRPIVVAAVVTGLVATSSIAVAAASPSDPAPRATGQATSATVDASAVGSPVAVSSADFDDTGLLDRLIGEWRKRIGPNPPRDSESPGAPAPTPTRPAPSPTPAPTPTPSRPAPTPTPTPPAPPTPSPAPPTPTPPTPAPPAPSPPAPPAPTPPAPTPPAPTPPAPTPPAPTPPAPDAPRQVIEGDLTVTEPGTVLENLDIRGRLIVRAADVTVRDSVIRGLPGTMRGIGMLVDNMPGHPGLVIADTELAPTHPSPYINGVMGSHFTLVRVHIHDVVDAVHITGDDVNIRESRLEDNLHYPLDPTQGLTPSHDDSIQIQQGRNIVIVDNEISGATNAGIQITQDRGPVRDLTVRGNTLDGGACTINVAEKGKGSVTGSIVDNVFGRDTRIDDCAIIAPPGTPLVVRGNEYEDGEPVRVTRGR